MSQLDTDSRILGAGFLDYQQEAIVELGSYKVTREECATVLGLSSTNAARNFQRHCEALRIASVAGLFATNPKEFAEAKHFGAGTMNVAIRVLRKNGYSILKWYKKATEDMVTFVSLKVREQREHERDKRAERSAAGKKRQWHQDQNVAEFKARASHRRHYQQAS